MSPTKKRVGQLVSRKRKRNVRETFSWKHLNTNTHQTYFWLYSHLYAHQSQFSWIRRVNCFQRRLIGLCLRRKRSIWPLISASEYPFFKIAEEMEMRSAPKWILNFCSCVKYPARMKYALSIKKETCRMLRWPNGKTGNLNICRLRASGPINFHT